MFFWALLLILIVIAYAILIIWALPNLVLKGKYPIEHPTDRGLKKYKFGESDYAVVYEPSLAARKYITQYVLAKKDGKKFFKCKIAPDVTFVDFDIVLFDAHEKCFLVINSMDISEPKSLPEEIELPEKTAYASIIVNQVNDRVINRAQTAQVSKGRLFGFGLLALMLSVGMSVCAMFAFSNVFGGLFRETFAEVMLSSGWIFFLPTLLSGAAIGGACYILYLRNSKR